VDYPPPLVPLEPPTRPSNPLALPNQLPSLPPQVFYACRQSKVRARHTRRGTRAGGQRAARPRNLDAGGSDHVYFRLKDGGQRLPLFGNLAAPPTRNPSLHREQPQGSFTEADIIALPGSPLPTVDPVQGWGEFTEKLRKGELYVNAHSVAHPTGEARGNLYSA
jgi:hypothetical protein